jgi:hypothetical protein
MIVKGHTVAELDELVEEAAAALLTRIKEMAEGTQDAPVLLDLARAYALVVDAGSATVLEDLDDDELLDYDEDPEVDE